MCLAASCVCEAAPADLEPVDEVGDFPAHGFGVLSCHHIVVLRRREPVHHDDVGRLLSLVQRRHQLSHPAFKHATQLVKGQNIQQLNMPFLVFLATNPVTVKKTSGSRQARGSLLTVHPWITRKVLEVLLKVQADRESALPGTM